MLCFAGHFQNRQNIAAALPKMKRFSDGSLEPCRDLRKGHDKKLNRCLLLYIPELAEAYGHIVMSLNWLVLVGSENAVPPGKCKAVVAVCFRDHYRMVHSMHIGCYQK